MGHQGRHVVGIRRHERECGHRAATAREHLDRPGAERLDNGMYVLRLDRGRMWATSWALKALTAADEKKIVTLVKKAVR